MPSRMLRTAIAAGAAGALLAACSADSLVERAVGMIDGVEGVDIDTESGSISIQGEDGALFEMDIDEEGQSSTITTEDGTITTAADQEYPAELAAVFAPPSSLEVAVVSEFIDGDTRAVMVQGEVTGTWEDLMEEIRASVEAGNWDEVQESTLAPGVMGGVVGTSSGDDGNRSLTVSLMLEENDPTGMLQIAYFVPNID